MGNKVLSGKDRKISVKTYIKHYKVQGDQLNMVVCFWYLVKSDFSSVHKSLFTRYQKNTIMFNRSACTCLTQRYHGGLLLVMAVQQYCDKTNENCPLAISNALNLWVLHIVLLLIAQA